MLYSIVVNWRTLVISFGPTFQDKLMIDHETVSIFNILLSSRQSGPGNNTELIFQNCLLMTFGLLHTTLNSLSYSAATAIIRYLYVRSSLQNSVQEVFKRNAFMFQSIFIVEFVGLFNVFSLYIMQRGKSGAERLPLLVYQTCLDPWSKLTQIQFKTMPVTYIILTQVADGCIIYFNVYLYKFLDRQSRENTGEETIQEKCSDFKFHKICFSFVTSRQTQGPKKKPCLCKSWILLFYFYVFV